MANISNELDSIKNASSVDGLKVAIFDALETISEISKDRDSELDSLKKTIQAISDEVNDLIKNSTPYDIDNLRDTLKAISLELSRKADTVDLVDTTDTLQTRSLPGGAILRSGDSPATQSDIIQLRADLISGLNTRATQYNFDYIVGNGFQGWTITDYIIRIREDYNTALAEMMTREQATEIAEHGVTEAGKIVTINTPYSFGTKHAVMVASEELHLAEISDIEDAVEEIEGYFSLDVIIEWEVGGLDEHGFNFDDATKYRSKGYIYSRNLSIKLNSSYSLQIVNYDKYKMMSSFGEWIPGGASTIEYAHDSSTAYYIRILLKKNNGTNVSYSANINNIAKITSVGHDAMKDEINSLRDSVYDNADTTVADAFSSSIDYQSGSYVINGDKLYKFDKEHSAGLWSNNDAVETVLSKNVANLESALDLTYSAMPVTTFTQLTHSGCIIAYDNGRLKIYGTPPTDRVVCCFNRYAFLAYTTRAFTAVLPEGIYKVNVHVYGSIQHTFVPRLVYTHSTFAEEYIRAYDNDVIKTDSPIMIGFLLIGETYFGTEEDPTYVDLRITPYYALAFKDNVLEASDINNMVIAKTRKRTASFCSWNFGSYINADGSVTSNIRGAFTELLPVSFNDVVYNYTPTRDSDNKAINTFLIEYNGTEFVRRVGLRRNSLYKVPEGVTDIRFQFGYTTADYITMTAKILLKYFDVAIDRNNIFGDGQMPVYVAIGASTTVGAVHHYTGTKVSYTTYAFPDYIGEALGLETHNLGEGSTGFMARNAGRQPNFMDVVYNNADVFSKADLITLIFGYGNDNEAGLPIGEWDDYYPYDAEGYFYVDGDTEGNQLRQTSMLEHGATLFGCLNWIIKWIGEHYPKAMLICILGWPSYNSGHSVTIVDGDGTSPKKISVNNSGSSLSGPFKTLGEKLSIPFIDLCSDGMPFSWYSTNATDELGQYVNFSTSGTPEEPIFNTHPSERGYLMYARYLAGRISQYFHH